MEGPLVERVIGRGAIGGALASAVRVYAASVMVVWET
jgi:hypothetical protein